jgi:cysteine desulfurase
MDRIYLDHAATTPVRYEVRKALVDITSQTFGNASSIHSFGQGAKRVLEESREQVASCIGAAPDELIFTSGGTESDNLAIRGTAQALKDKGNHIITTAIEHPAVLSCCKSLEEEGFEVSYVPVDSECLVDPKAIAEAIRPETILITVMAANNETGTVQPIPEIAEIARGSGVALHSDAVQAVGKIPVNVNSFGVDLLSISGHKIYGPKGIGALYVRKGTALRPLLVGGHHEKSLRPGTENVPGIAAFAMAVKLAVWELPDSEPDLEGTAGVWNHGEDRCGAQKREQGQFLAQYPEYEFRRCRRRVFASQPGPLRVRGLHRVGLHVRGDRSFPCAARDGPLLPARPIEHQVLAGSRQFGRGHRPASPCAARHSLEAS